MIDMTEGVDLSTMRQEFYLLTEEINKTLAAVRMLKAELNGPDDQSEPPEGA